MIGKIFIVISIIPWICIIGEPAEASKWSGVLDESLDERHDAEIFRAVVESMRQWENHKKNSHRIKRSTSRVCYEEVGCFEDTGPFSYLEMLPSHPKDVGTRFFMYGSRKARSVPMEVPADDINDKANNAIDPDLPTKVIVHGFGSGCEHVWVYEMRSALMSLHDCNIVCVDWSLGSAIPNYVRAAANTRLVGRQLAKLVRSLNVPLEKVHLIGFSLGAHVAGFAGAELANISRITGLDPAGPLFEAQDPRARLDETDATFVDVIHSNGEQLILGGLGSWQPMGDVDFYPNGGKMQTGCSNLFLGAVSDIIWSGSVEGQSLCNHRRAYKLFTDSISPKCRFPAFPCETGYDGLLKGNCFPCGAGIENDRSACGEMGYYSDTTGARGQLYLLTREEEPFCAHQYQVKVYNSRSERPARSYGKLQLTLVGESHFNDTFTMTRKDDEELHVGSILQKIVVPHPAVAHLEAIEIKYTAYSGWISSGLVSWSVDKISVLDSFGKSLSVCMRGLILESGRGVFLPLYPGECNIPVDMDEAVEVTGQMENGTRSAAMKMEPTDIKTKEEDKPVGGIGPFTRQQNYVIKDIFQGETTCNGEGDRPCASKEKGVGPFTKDQNAKSPNAEEPIQLAFVPKDNTGDVTITDANKSVVSSPWSYVDVSEAGSNFLENTEIETGRGFSGTNFVPGTPVTPIGPNLTTIGSYRPEIREPVLQVGKKETGRSMRLPEITEPILRPRSTRQNLKSEERTTPEVPSTLTDTEQSAMTNSSHIQKSITVQFLPERIAEILAQAERYARRTLLPLISQYTPSFVAGGSRQERLKYFPPLVDRDEETTVIAEVAGSHKDGRNGRSNNEVEISESRSSDPPSRISSPDAISAHEEETLSLGTLATSRGESSPSSSSDPTTTMADPMTLRTKNGERGSEEPAGSSRSDWIPIGNGENVPIKSANSSSPGRSSRNEAREDAWTSEGAISWSPPIVDTKAIGETKINDWIPILATMRKNSSTPVSSSDHETGIGGTKNFADPVTSESPWKAIPTPKVDADAPTGSVAGSRSSEENGERRFIPLVDFESRDGSLAPRDLDTIVPGRSHIAEAREQRDETVANVVTSHIQKIPGPSKEQRDLSAAGNKRAIVFPYAYERNKDPRTRYIPLIPDEDMGRRTSAALMEKDR